MARWHAIGGPPNDRSNYKSTMFPGRCFYKMIERVVGVSVFVCVCSHCVCNSNGCVTHKSTHRLERVEMDSTQLTAPGGVKSEDFR